MKVYLIHAKQLKNRLSHFVDILFNCEFVEDVEIVTTETGSLKFATAEEARQTLPPDFPHQLTTSLEQSVYHKHFRIFKKITDNGEPAIVLEDDVIFDPTRFDQFVEECKNMPADLDWCFFGTGLNMTIPGSGFIKNQNRLKSKCADSMLIHPRAAQIVYDDLVNDRVYAAIDWDLNWRFLKHNMNIYWYEPGIITQGSENGKFAPCHNR